jgi:hypothetical protein
MYVKIGNREYKLTTPTQTRPTQFSKTCTDENVHLVQLTRLPLFQPLRNHLKLEQPVRPWHTSTEGHLLHIQVMNHPDSTDM